jgi:hypothetical protein
LSGQMYFSEWNLCSSRYSLRSARCDCRERNLNRQTGTRETSESELCPKYTAKDGE